jgi:hypothetical protein
MTIIGKILVVLNLVLAVAVGGFMIFSSVTNKNWKAYADAREEDSKALAISRDTWKETAALAQNQAREERAKRLALEKSRVTDVTENSEQLKVMRIQMDEIGLRLKEADLNAQKSVAEAKRLQDEAEVLRKTIANREGLVLEITEKYQEKTKEYVAEKERADNLQIRAQSLQEQYRLAQVELGRREAQQAAGGSEGGPAAQPQDPSKPNPPSRDVKGKIVKVDPESGTLVSVNVGREEGVDKNHTLEVFRTSPTPEYLGMIRIVDVDNHQATGRLIRNQYTPTKALREGDTVASRLR